MMEETDMKTSRQEFYVIIERDEDGYYIGEVPQLRACYSQGATLDELMANIREVIELCLEEEGEEVVSEFVGIQKVAL
jgi:predicted RNase H-like HicB family nuclease